MMTMIVTMTTTMMMGTTTTILNNNILNHCLTGLLPNFIAENPLKFSQESKPIEKC